MAIRRQPVRRARVRRNPLLSSGADPTPRAFPELTLLGRSRTPVPIAPSAATLESFPNPRPDRAYRIRFDCPEFTSLCPVTGQPDFGHIVIEYTPRGLCLESKSLKLYLLAFRNHGAFHEDAVNRILTDLVRAVRPRQAVVTGDFRPRGGIAIRVTASHPSRSGTAA